MLVHPNRSPAQFEMNGLHLWCTPYADDPLILPVNIKQCEEKLAGLKSDIDSKKSDPTAPTCPVSPNIYTAPPQMEMQVPFLISDLHLRNREEQITGGQDSNNKLQRT